MQGILIMNDLRGYAEVQPGHSIGWRARNRNNRFQIYNHSCLVLVETVRHESDTEDHDH